MEISPISHTSFKMAIKVTPKARDFLSEHLSKRDLNKIEKLAEIAKKDSVDIQLSTVKQYSSGGLLRLVPHDQLVITVGENYKQYYPEAKSFYIKNALKKAVKDAHFLSENKRALD